jgi:hypothetical protein
MVFVMAQVQHTKFSGSPNGGKDRPYYCNITRQTGNPEGWAEQEQANLARMMGGLEDGPRFRIASTSRGNGR